MSELRKQRAKEIRDRVRELILPTAPNQYSTTALCESDLDQHTVNMLKSFTAGGKETFLWRATVDGSTLIQTSLADLQFGLTVQLNSFPGSGDWRTVFDRYRIKGISVTLSPVITTITANNVILPRLWTAIDYDDANVVSRASIQQFDTCVVSPPGSGITRTWVPHVALAAYSGAFTSYANQESQWIDIASDTVQHYGLKVVVEGAAASQNPLQNYTVSITGFIEFQSAR